MIEEVREAVCGECVHCDACKNMMDSCSPKSVPNSVITDFRKMPAGRCPHFAGRVSSGREAMDDEIACLKMALDERTKKYEALHNEYEKTKEAREQISEKFQCLSRENDMLCAKLDMLRAQLDIVHLIFGKR